jgi:hypothetical protein
LLACDQQRDHSRGVVLGEVRVGALRAVECECWQAVSLVLESGDGRGGAGE